MVYQYEQGDSAEKIHESFPALRLNHREQVNDYLRDQEKKARAVRDDIESDPAYKASTDELQERIKSRYSSQHPSE